MVEGLAELIRKADYVIGHNVDRFDLPVLNTRLIDLRLEPIPPVKTVDTLKIAKRSFRFTYNRLSYLAEFLGLEPKHPMDMADWVSAVKGDRAAIRKMRDYCSQDIEVLEQVFDELAPYAKGLPRFFTAAHEMQRACPYCGEDDFTKVLPSGWHTTNASRFQRYRCETCGKFSRSRSASVNQKLALSPL